MIENAAAYLRRHGRQALLAEVNGLSRGQFIDRDLYLSINDLRSTEIVAHGSNPRLIGMNSKQLKDAEGRLFVDEIINLARTRGEGWTRYKWVHSLTKEVMLKQTYVKRADDLVLVCGFYPK
jgi:signal transduction histidine kinase